MRRRQDLNIPDFGSLITTADVEMLDDSDLPHGLNDPVAPDPNNPLWEYVNLGTIDGYKVAESDLGLPIESAERLMTALTPVLTPASEILVISPDDSKGLERYNEIRAMEANKAIVVTGESSQYDSARSAYITWIKYSYVEYRLAPRFNYLREER